MPWEQSVTGGVCFFFFSLTFIKSNDKVSMRVLHQTVMPVYKIITQNWMRK